MYILKRGDDISFLSISNNKYWTLTLQFYHQLLCQKNVPRVPKWESLDNIVDLESVKRNLNFYSFVCFVRSSRVICSVNSISYLDELFFALIANDVINIQAVYTRSLFCLSSFQLPVSIRIEYNTLVLGYQHIYPDIFESETFSLRIRLPSTRIQRIR